MITEKLYKTIDIGNGLKIEIFDGSKNIVGDRWLVTFIARMEIQISETYPLKDNQYTVNIDDIIKTLGAKVVFEKKIERFFIDEKVKNDVFYELYELFSKNILSYLSNPEFPKRFIMKRYNDYLRKKHM